MSVKPTIPVEDFFNKLDEIKFTSGRNDKLLLLTGLINSDPYLTSLLYKLGLDPDITTFIATTPKPAESTTLDIPLWKTNPRDLIFSIVRSVEDQSVTGLRLPKKVIQEYFLAMRECLPENGQTWMRQALTKDWTLGTSISSFNKALKNSDFSEEIGRIEEFDTVRVSNIQDSDIDPEGSYCGIKKDGVNASLLPRGILSRNGNRIWLKHIEEAIPPHITDKYKLMGELVSTDRQSSSGLCNSAISLGYETTSPVHKLQLHIFDAILLEEYNTREFVTPFHERIELAERLVSEINHPDIILIEQIRVNSLEEVLAINDSVVKESGEEGVIWNDRNMLFGIHRSTKRARIKEVFDGDFEITGYKEHRKNKGTLGSFIFQTKCGQLTASAGSGLTKKQRLDFWNNREKFLGKILKAYYNKVIPHRLEKGKMTLFLPVLNQNEIIRIDKDVADTLDLLELGGKKTAK